MVASILTQTGDRLEDSGYPGQVIRAEHGFARAVDVAVSDYRLLSYGRRDAVEMCIEQQRLATA